MCCLHEVQVSVTEGPMQTQTQVRVQATFRLLRRDRLKLLQPIKAGSDSEWTKGCDVLGL